MSRKGNDVGCWSSSFVSHVRSGGTVQLEQATNNQMYVHYSSAYFPKIDSYQFAIAIEYGSAIRKEHRLKQIHYHNGAMNERAA